MDEASGDDQERQSHFSNLQALTNQLDDDVARTTTTAAAAPDYESGDDNNESVEDNSIEPDTELTTGQMNISNDECCCLATPGGDDQHCQSVIYSNFDTDGRATVFESNMSKLLSDNPDLVLTVDEEEEEEPDLTINTNMTKVSDSTNQQDEDYIDEDFAPNQLNVCSSDEECDNLEVIKDEMTSRLKNNFGQECCCGSKASQHEFKVNDLTTVNDFNAAAAATAATSLVSSDSADQGTVLFQDESPEVSSSLPDFAQLRLSAENSSDKSFVKNIDEPRPASLKFESVSSIEDNSNDFLPSAYSSKAQTINECPSSSSASLTTESVDVVSGENEAHIWTETEALLLQHEQTSPSACGASAIINVLVRVTT